MKRSMLAALAVAIAVLVAAVGTANAAPADVQADVPTGALLESASPSAFSAPRSVPADPARKGSKGPKNFLTGFGDFNYTSGSASTREALFDDTVSAGGKVVRLYASWRKIAPASNGGGFQATDPSSPGYNWDTLDSAVREADAHGLRVLLLVNEAPSWAQGPNRPKGVRPGTWKPNPGDVGDFGTAIARRYSGNFGNLPQVKDFILWNEPTIPYWLNPQWEGPDNKTPASPDIYRKMLNAFYKAVHNVSNKNNVITAGTPPYGMDPGKYSVRPLWFWREVLCVKDDKKLSATSCPTKAKFDVLAHHPINTSGPPTQGAVNPDDISTPDLHRLVDVLRAAERNGTVGTKGKHPVWATELWWESNPPDKSSRAVSLRTQAAYYSQALYLLWKQGASMTLIYQVRDDPPDNGCPGFGNGCPYETGVYFVNGDAKPSKRVLEFPFVGDRKSKKKVTLWGIAPASGKLTVTQKGKGSKKVASFKVKRGKVFNKTVGMKKSGGEHSLTAKVNGSKSLSYKVK